jgi:hypothetical protein
MTGSPLAVARACLQAYVAKDRAAIEGLIASGARRRREIDVCHPLRAAILVL